MKIKCINNKHQTKQLTIGKVYTVKKLVVKTMMNILLKLMMECFGECQ